MTNFEAILGTLTEAANADKCTAARKEDKPLPCKFSKVGNTVYCTVHKGLAPNNINK